LRIAFLHIPKTAGQSVHNSLIGLFLDGEVCPARTNKDLYKYSVSDLSKYNLFSGHLDWSILKLCGQFDYVFTVLRDPLARILSYYFYLRKEAERKLADGLPIAQGLQSVINLTPEEYFTAGRPEIRKFIDNHYNNFYSYYFASGCYDGYSQLAMKYPPGSVELINYALSGLNCLDGVYTLSTLDKLERDIASLAGRPIKPILELNVNRETHPSKREEMLDSLANRWDWQPVLNNLIISDEYIYRGLKP
jgi:hypothetical protein